MKGYVQVYRNLNKRLHDGDHGPVYSVRGSDGLVKCHTCHLVLRDCTFRVSDKGNERVRDEQRKNVHAYIIGDWHNEGEVSKTRFRKRGEIIEEYRICECEDDYCEKCVPESGAEFRGGYYNPYKYKTFVDDIEKTPIFKSERVVVRDKTAVGPHYNIFYTPKKKK